MPPYNGAQSMQLLDRRPLGSTGETLSVVGFGGILVNGETATEADRLVGLGVQRGVNYFDVAPSYGDAEEKLGPALKPHRKSAFLACKTTERGREGAAYELRQSLKRLKTDHVDLYQLHGLTSREEAEKCLAPNGALSAVVAARQAGLVRFIGFSSHSEEAALAAMAGFDFDTMMIPLNVYAWHLGGFGRDALAEARKRRMGILALKALARRSVREGEQKPWKKCWYVPVETYEEARTAMRFTLSLPVTAAVSPGHEQLFIWACDAADSCAKEVGPFKGPPPGLGEGDEPVFRTERAAGSGNSQEKGEGE